MLGVWERPDSSRRDVTASSFSVAWVPIPEEEEDTADTPRGHRAGVIWSRGSGMLREASE